MTDEETQITQDNLILDDLTELNTSITDKTYYVFFGDEEIKVNRIVTHDDDAGFIDDEWNFETDLDLTDEDKETIKLFCLGQDNE